MEPVLKKPRGLGPRGVAHGNTKYSDETLITAVQRLAAVHGDALTFQMFCRETGVASTTIHARFGGWFRLREEAGLPRKKGTRHLVRVHSTEHLQDLLRSLIRQTGPHVTQAEFCHRMQISNATIQRYCRGWKNLRLSIGLKARPQAHREWSETDLLFELHRVVQRVGAFPTVADLEREARISVPVFYARFGTLTRLRQKYAAFAVRLTRVLAEAARNVGEVKRNREDASVG